MKHSTVGRFPSCTLETLRPMPPRCGLGRFFIVTPVRRRRFQRLVISYLSFAIETHLSSWFLASQMTSEK